MDKRLTQKHQLESENTLQQVIRQSENIQKQLFHEQEAAKRRTGEMEKKNHGLHQQVSSFMPDVVSVSIMGLQ